MKIEKENLKYFDYLNGHREYLEKNFNLVETKKRNEKKLNKIAFNRGSLYVDEISFSRQMSSNEESFLE